MKVELAIAALGCAALGWRVRACGYGAGLLDGSPPSASPPAPSGAAGPRGDRGAVLDSIQVSLAPVRQPSLGRRRKVHQ
jgi:hypothetical protein